jgi:hypothetical protein
MKIKIKHLREAKLENVIRLAKWLKLNIEGMSIKQIIRLVYWKITRNTLNRH